MDIDIIYNEDCFETFKRMDDKSIDMILCDLPYGVTALSWDSVIPLEPLWKEYKRIIKKNGAIVLTASQPFTSKLVMSNLEMFRYEWIWEKDKPSNFVFARYGVMKYHENILAFYNGRVTYNPQMTLGKPNHSTGKGIVKSKERVLNMKVVFNKTDGIKHPKSIIKFPRVPIPEHPTQKPVALFEYLIKTYTNENELILDNCIGSGTTAIACINTNRHFIGCELEKKYYDIAVKRIEEAKQKVKLL